MFMPVQGTREVGYGDDLFIEVCNDLHEMRDMWRAFQRDALGGPHDTWEWNDAWARSTANSCKPLIVVGRDRAGDILFLLPLTIHKHLGCAILEWFGASQGNYASGLYHPAAWSQGHLPQGEDLLRVILSALPPVDVVHLDKNPEKLGSENNPLASLPSIGEASAGYSFPLSHDWNAHFTERTSKSHRHKLRRSMRRLSEEGDLTFKLIESGPERLAVLHAIIEEKKQWFAEKGIANFFEDPEIHNFFELLVQLPDRKDGLSTSMFCLRVDGEFIAANIGLIFQNRLYGLITCTAYGPMRRYGPGRILFLRTVERLAEMGIEAIDCGAGEDENKLRWCTEQRIRLHSLVPITAKGRLFTSALRAELVVKLQIKQSPQLWRMAKRLRQWTSPLRLSEETKGVGSPAPGLKG